jgi:asparagine synthetase B (glutamine-hydrolysing)
MCGLWGYAGTGCARETILQAAAGAATRGPHAWGIVTDDPYPSRTVALGALADSLEEAADLAQGHRAVLGHARLATTGVGSVHEPRDVQPIVVDGVAVSHNGRVPEAAGWAQMLGYEARTGNDSEILAAAIAAGRGALLRRIQDALGMLGGNGPQAVVAMSETELAAVSQGHPLYVLHRGEGEYLCSRELLGAERIAWGWQRVW